MSTARALTIIAVCAIAAAGLLALARIAAPGALEGGDAQLNFVYLVGLLSLIIVAGGAARFSDIGKTIAQALVWAGVFVVMIALYGFRAEFSEIGRRVRGELAPSAALSVAGEPNAAELRRGVDGHFSATATIDGARVRFLIDTGATSLTLTRRDAAHVGIDVDALAYTVRVTTASGRAWAAPIRLASVKVGAVEVKNVSALVADDGLGVSLLGMSYLGRLSSMETRGDRLILRE